MNGLVCDVCGLHECVLPAFCAQCRANDRAKAKANGRGKEKLLMSNVDFVGSYVAPNYVVDGILQRGYLYALTAQTGHGKTAVALYIAMCVALGRLMHERRVKEGFVLYLAGENTQDHKGRMHAMGEVYGFEQSELKFAWIDGRIPFDELFDRIAAEVGELSDALMLVVVDTAMAYFLGDDANDNVQAAAYAAKLRRLCTLPGRPCVLVCCHPIKNATRDNLKPAGGGAFLNELDGNLTLWSNDNDREHTELYWQKIRGPDFNPLVFRLATGWSERAVDSGGRKMPQVVARPVTDAESDVSSATIVKEEDRLLRYVNAYPQASVTFLCDKMGYVSELDRKPQKSKLFRMINSLVDGKLLRKLRGGKYEATEKGKAIIGV